MGGAAARPRRHSFVLARLALDRPSRLPPPPLPDENKLQLADDAGLPLGLLVQHAHPKVSGLASRCINMLTVDREMLVKQSIPDSVKTEDGLEEDISFGDDDTFTLKRQDRMTGDGSEFLIVGQNGAAGEAANGGDVKLQGGAAALPDAT